MSDRMDFTPELARPPGHANLREQLNDALRELAAERQARAAAEADAVQMAEYIASRVDARVWSHDDVIRVVAATVAALMENPLSVLAAAKAKGIPPAYSMFAEILNRRALELRIELMDALASGELDSRKLASEEMREMLLARYPKLPDVD